MKIDKELGIRLIEKAIEKGADLAEVYVKTGRSLTVEVKEQKVSAIESSLDFGFSIRIIRDGRLGFSFSTTHQPNPDSIDEVIDRAIEASRWTEKDRFLSLPHGSETGEMNIFDTSVADISEDLAIEKALSIEKAALNEDRRIKKVRKASATFSEKYVHIFNSLGLSKEYRATACIAQIMVVAEDSGEGQMGWDFYGSRFLNSLCFEDVGRNAARRALKLLGAKRITPEKIKIILDNSVATEFLGLFSALLSSENVQKGKSLLSNKLSQQVVSPVINIIDDPTIEVYLGSRPFDDEGVASSIRYLIRDGILIDYMYNTYTANKEGRESTGNAVRHGYSSLPSVGPSNLFISSERAIPVKSLIESLDRGVYITEVMGLHTANPVSGEFSIGVSGLWIEKGMVRYPIKEAIISGNILELFSKVEALGDDLRFYGNSGSPSLLIGPTDLSA
ncbi:MAG: TldD/PmbA family protein [Thermodesulfovibrionales bacterium]